jgi:hypothetical protein
MNGVKDELRMKDNKSELIDEYFVVLCKHEGKQSCLLGK